jgi:ABC-type bacteriocin/lantibiotic exporter with double-glycine peptidase domain
MPMHAQTKFFRGLAGQAGRAIPGRTIDAAVAPLAAAVVAAEAPPAERIARLADLCGQLGLGLTPVRARFDEAVAMVAERRPVLFLMRRGDEVELLAVYGVDGPTVRIERLRGARHEVQTAPRGEVGAGLAPEEGEIEAVFQVRSIGRADAAIPPSYEGRPFLRLWHLLEPDRTEIWIVIGFAAGLGVLTLATPIAVQALVNFIAFGGLMQPLVVVGLLLLFFLGFAGAIRVFKFYVVEVLQRRVFVRVVSDLSARLPRVRLDVYDRGHGPELVNRFFDVLTIQKAGSALLIDGLDIVLQAGIGLLVLGFYHPFLLVFDVLLILAIAFILLGLGRGAVATARKESQAKYEVAGALEELARAPVTYKLAGAPEFARAKLAELAGNYITNRRKHYGVVLRQLIGSVTLHAIAGTALLSLGGLLVIEGQLTLGQLVAAELIVSAALASFVKFGKQLEATYDLLAGVDKLGLLFDLPLDDDEGESHVPVGEAADLELRDVSYRYPGRPTGVRGINLRVRAHERVAVRGPRGAGKSTVAELVSGLRDPDSGVVLFDGVDIREVANVSIRTQMDLVKGLEIVAGSILDNVRLGRSDVSTQEVREALQRFGILDELLALPDGLRTEITSAGSPLSRGTAQLVMLARAVVGRPRAVVVDGVLDELDPSARMRALEVLSDRSAPWTLVVFTAFDEVCGPMDRVVDLGAAAPAAGPDGGHD